MDRRNLQLHDGKDRGIGRMGVDNGIHFGARFEDIQVKAPFARWALIGVERPVPIHEHNLLGLHRLIGRAGRRNQHAIAMAQADISGSALIDAQLVHAQTGIDDGLALCPVIRARH